MWALLYSGTVATMQFGTLDQFDELVAKGGMKPGELTPVQIAELSEFIVRDPSLPQITAQDPRSDHYRNQVLALHAAISGWREPYAAASNELCPYLEPAAAAAQPHIYKQGDGPYLADFLASFAAILRAMGVKAGHSVIEYGAGEGQLAIMLARMGCRVAAVDIEPKYLEAIALQCGALGVEITPHAGLFGSAPSGFERVDRIVFFESFHHAVDHEALIPRLRDRLDEDGAIVMAGEPILEDGNYWLPVIPYLWGPRLDGLSVFAMRSYGWCELGFREQYLLELFDRHGFTTTKTECPMTARGNTYVFRKKPAKKRWFWGSRDRA